MGTREGGSRHLRREKPKPGLGCYSFASSRDRLSQQRYISI